MLCKSFAFFGFNFLSIPFGRFPLSNQFEIKEVTTLYSPYLNKKWGEYLQVTTAAHYHKYVANLLKGFA
jgi:hypothetical protein